MKHDFLVQTGTALIDALSKKMEPFSAAINAKFPIYINNTGDEVFLTNMYKDDPKKLYSRIPSMKLECSGINIESDQLTNNGVLGSFTDDVAGYKKEKKANVRRMPIVLQYNAEIQCNNILEYFTLCEIIMMQLYKNQHFSFYWAGTKHDGRYIIPDSLDSQANLSLGFDTDRRRRILNFPIEVYVQYPAFDYYNDTSEVFPADGSMQYIIHNTEVDDIHVNTNTIPKQD